jgi:hypothetical protein
MPIKFEGILPDIKKVEKNIIAAIETTINEHLSKFKCAEHDKSATVKVSGSGKDPKFQVQACCKEYAEEVAEALKEIDS